MMPLLFGLFLIVIIRSVTLPGAMEGIAFFLTPDISQLNSAKYFTHWDSRSFALSIGATTMITYASYLGKSRPDSICTIDCFDERDNINHGRFYIFPAIASLSMEAAEGPGPVFIKVAAGFR